MKKDLVITIDGPAGSGKTTVSRILAQRLGYRYVDTGALYRGVAWEVLARNVDPDDEGALGRMVAELNLQLVMGADGLRLFSEDTDISQAIRTPAVTMMASTVSAKTVVRDYLLQIQRRMGAEKRAVFEGRDMGTVVFPEADVKFFLLASPHIRALRRFEEMPPENRPSLADVERDMRIRDENDRSRKIAPLKPAADAVEIDSSRFAVSEVVDQMMFWIRRKNVSEGGKV